MRTPAPASGSPTTERTERRPRWRRWLLELGVVVFVYFALSSFRSHGLLDEAAPAPDFELTTLQGRRVRLSDWAGKRTLLHFWATWCGVCEREYATLNALHADLAEDEAIVSIVADADDPAHVEEVVAREGINYPVLLASPEVLRAFHIEAFPTNYFIDERGTIRDRTVGMSTRWSLGARLGCAKQE